MRAIPRTLALVLLPLALLVPSACSDDDDGGDGATGGGGGAGAVTTVSPPLGEPALRSYCDRTRPENLKLDFSTRAKGIESYRVMEANAKASPPELSNANATILSWLRNVTNAPDEDEYMRRLGTAGPELAQAYNDALAFRLQRC